MNNWKTWAAALLTGVLVGATALHAGELRLAKIYGDGMVVQRDKPAVLRGFAKNGASVEVSFAGKKKTAKAGTDGRWSVALDPMPASRDAKALTVSSAGETVRVDNVLVGDVFLFARQTSIDVSLGRDKTGQKAASSHKKNPLLRAISITTIPAAKPQSDLAEDATRGWAEVNKESALEMTAAAYYFGRNLSAAQDAPIGIVDINLGSSFPISWLSHESLEETEKLYGKSDVPGMLNRFDALIELAAKGEPMPNKECVQSNHTEYAIFPAAGYNAVINPLKGLTLKAALIQLGNDYPYMIYASLEKSGTQFNRPELNRTYVQTYDIRKNGFRMEPVTTPRVPREWRDAFGDQDLPIGLVVPPGSALNTLGQHHREMRELQRLTAEDNAGVGLILPGTENVVMSAQPADEALLGDRCAKWVQGAVYQKDGVPATGPLFERLEAKFNEATIYFKAGTAKGLKAVGDALDYFEAAGVDAVYSPVKATVDGETIRLASDTVPRIVHVRYNWNHKPNQGLVNALGLPAIPFRSEEAAYNWFVTNEETDLPMEYFTPANEWKKSDVTLINGQMKTHGYDNFTGWLGPVGVKTGPFGPNMGVREVKAGSPADGKLLVGDIIYSANGNMLGEKAWEVMGAAITESETREKGGELLLGVRRDGRNKEIEVTLEVMGAYSPTAPFDCPKTEKIIADLEAWLVANGPGAGYLNTDAIFMLATGNPEMLGYVRRIVYDMMAKLDPSKSIEPVGGPKSWHSSANAFLFGEYYLATGDRNVLPYLKWYCDRLASTQNPAGGWRHNFPGGATYGLIPNAGLPGVMGMHFALEAGVDINKDSYELGVKHFGTMRAETGFLIYGFGGCEREVPAPIDPEALATGHLETYTGGLSAAGILMGFAGKPRAAHLCSFISSYSWNNTFGGHGGNFWNNFWSPLGANAHSKPAFINFWKNYRWYRECNRMYDGSLIQNETGGNVGAGTGVVLVAPRRRLQAVGAPTSPFSVNAPEGLKPALDTYWAKDYAGCEKLVTDLIATGSVGKDDLPTVEYLARAAHEVQDSIAIDLSRIHKLLSEGDVTGARADLRQLEGVMAADDTRLAAVKKAVAATKPVSLPKPDNKKSVAAAAEEAPREWECLVTEIETPQSKNKGPGKVDATEANVWRMKVVEDISQAPEDWTEPKFDDSEWDETPLPISWRMYHTALLRTKFNVKNRKAFDGLRFRGWLFRQQGIEIYLNGELIGKVNNLEKKTGDVEAEFKESAVKHLKNGENTLCVTTRHNWRWGMLFMHVYNDGFGFRLDARKRD